MLYKNYQGDRTRESSPASTEGEPGQLQAEEEARPRCGSCGAKAEPCEDSAGEVSSEEESVDDSFDRDPEVKRNVFELMDKLGAEYDVQSRDCWLKDGRRQDCGVLSLEYSHLQELNARLVFDGKVLIGMALEEENGFPLYTKYHKD